MLLTGVRCVFRNLDSTFPKQMIREYGTEIKFGSILALNPLLVTFMVPMFMFLSNKMNAYDQICLGIMITTLSPMFLAIETNIWMALLFVFTLSLGESIWSPRLYEQCMKIAKDGYEGTQIALSSAPLFLSIFVSGIMSGYLLESQCPKEGVRQSWKMWFVIGFFSSMCSVVVIIFEKYLRIEDKDEFEKVECIQMFFDVIRGKTRKDDYVSKPTLSHNADLDLNNNCEKVKLINNESIYEDKVINMEQNIDINIKQSNKDNSRNITFGSND